MTREKDERFASDVVTLMDGVLGIVKETRTLGVLVGTRVTSVEHYCLDPVNSCFGNFCLSENR